MRHIATTRGDEKSLTIVEKKFLRRIYGLQKNNDQTYEIRSNREQESFEKPNIIAEIQHKRLSWLVHVLKVNLIANDVFNWTS